MKSDRGANPGGQPCVADCLCRDAGNDMEEALPVAHEVADNLCQP
jgi:hypothetical protein